MKKYIMPNIKVVTFSQDMNLMAGSLTIENGPNVSDVEHAGGSSWSRRGSSFWDDGDVDEE